MAQRQFRLDDTSAWGDRYAGALDSNRTISSDTTFGSYSGEVYIDVTTGTLAATSITISSDPGFANGDLVLIHQTRHSTGGGFWELNKIVSGAGTTTLTLQYALTNTYQTSGQDRAQIIALNQYNILTLNGGVSWYVPQWDFNKGGILAFICSNEAIISGTINGQGRGFHGSAGANDSGDSGEGDKTDGNAGQTNPDDSGGGGGDGGGGSGGSGGGGGNNGGGASDGNQIGGVTTGKAGLTAGNIGLTIMTLGGGGGSGGGNGSDPGGSGGNGGGLCFIIARKITVTGQIYLRGNDGSGSSGNRGSGGGGGGGSCLLKGQVVVVGSAIVTAGGSSGGVGGTQGGAGGYGRIHIDYALQLTGTTSPAADTRLDGMLSDFGGGMLFNLL